MQNQEYENLEACVDAAFEAASAYAIDGVKENIGGPFGAGIIRQNENGRYEIVTIQRNTVISAKDPTAHAEVNAIRSTCEKLNARSLAGCILVTTAKSCPMCLSAACWADIRTIYYSEDYESAVTSGFRDESIAEYIQGKNHIISEKQIKKTCCEQPFVTWNQKADKIMY